MTYRIVIAAVLLLAISGCGESPKSPDVAGVDYPAVMIRGATTGNIIDSYRVDEYTLHDGCVTWSYLGLAKRTVCGNFELWEPTKNTK